jgi:type II secretory pathway component PulK
MLLSLFAASIGSRALFAITLTERLTERLRASSLARAGAQYALLALEQDETPAVDGSVDSWANNPGLFQEHGLPGGSFRIIAEAGGERRYGLTDQERRLNLNTAPGEVLQRLFESAGGLGKEEALELSEAIEDWRDEDDKTRSHGAEGFYYRSLSSGYDCKNAPFENLEELLLIRGMTPELYAVLAPHLTVHGSGLLNLNTASRPVLESLGLSAFGVDGLLAFRAGEDNAAGTADDRMLVSAQSLEPLRAFVPAEDLAVLEALAQDRALGVGSTEVGMRIEAAADRSRRPLTVSCVISRDGHIKQWSER